jgi:hypothetical protein
MAITYHRTIDGQQVSENEALDARGILRPGHSARTSAAIMDGAPAPVTEEQRRALLDGYKARISNAWRNPAASFREDDGVIKLRDEALAKIGDPYERHERWLRDAWR